MPKVSELIAMLKSPNANKRYDACEELRVMPIIPEDAKTGLRAVLNDPDPLVADAATRALELHTRPPSPSELPTPVPLPPIGRSDLGLAIAGLAVTVVSASIAYPILAFFATPPNYRDWDWENLAESIRYLLAIPFHAGPLIHPFRFPGLLYLVAPCCALLLRGRPKLRTDVIVAGCISGVLYDIVALIAYVAFLSD